MIYAVLGITGALIGWLTNVVAVWLLFRPRRAIRLGPWQIQGLLPQRQKEIARSIGEALERELISSSDLTGRLRDPAWKSALLVSLTNRAMEELDRHLPAFLPRLLRLWIKQQVGRVVEREGLRALDGVLADVVANFTELRLGKIVEERLKAFSLERLEKLCWQVAGRELRYIEYVGGVLGLLIGLAQAALVTTGWVR
ncbi:MAG: hypothetical protein PWP58_678 [Bacillota bacterium]|nr:hypothetical protein [Bacillota bacterium]